MSITAHVGSPTGRTITIQQGDGGVIDQPVEAREALDKMGNSTTIYIDGSSSPLTRNDLRLIANPEDTSSVTDTIVKNARFLADTFIRYTGCPLRNRWF